MAFTAADVKKLREMTNVGMMDCKKALAETDGDMDKAVEYLREKGLAKAAKRLAVSLPKAWLTLPFWTAPASSSRSTLRPTSLPRLMLSWAWLRACVRSLPRTLPLTWTL